MQIANLRKMMKKYILLVSVFCISFLQLSAEEGTVNSVQDSVKIFRKKLNLDKVKKDLEDIEIDIDTSFLNEIGESLNSVDLVDVEKIVAMAESVASEAKENLRDLKLNSKLGLKEAKEKSDGAPTRIEKQSYSNISEIKFVHQHGNIIVRESASKQVELETHYFDNNKILASSTLINKNGLLSITSNNSRGNGFGPKVNYIINIPRNVKLDVNLRYGDMRIDRYSGELSANLSYSNLSAQSLKGAKSDLKMRYSDVKIDEANDLFVSGGYSDVKIRKVNNVELSGNYNDFAFEEALSVVSRGSVFYGELKVGTISSIVGDFKYTDIVVKNLLSSLDILSNYGDVTIKAVSPKLKNIKYIGNYADISLTLPSNLSATFSALLNYGDISISKQHHMNVTQSTETNISTIRKGKIGSGTPTATISITSNYADVEIK